MLPRLRSLALPGGSAKLCQRSVPSLSACSSTSCCSSTSALAGSASFFSTSVQSPSPSSSSSSSSSPSSSSSSAFPSTCPASSTCPSSPSSSSSSSPSPRSAPRFGPPARSAWVLEASVMRKALQFRGLYHQNINSDPSEGPSALRSMLFLGGLSSILLGLSQQSGVQCADGGDTKGFLADDAQAFLADEGIYLPVKLCLLGSTGSGKSALGNFILRPNDDHIFEAQTFETGETSESCTEACKVAGEGEGVLVVDTPGYNEGHSKDLEHMIGVAKVLQDMGPTHAVVLVKRYDARLDQPWRETVEYYRNLMGTAMLRNVIVVLTAYNPPSAKRQKAFGVRHTEKMTQTAREVQDLLQLATPPQVFVIESMPESETAWQASLETRRQILRHCARLRPTAMDTLLVPKTAQIQHQDEEEASHLEGQINELETRVKNLRVFAWAAQGKGRGVTTSPDASALDANLKSAVASDMSGTQRKLLNFLAAGEDDDVGDDSIDNPMKDLQRKIKEKRAKMEKLRSTHMTLEEAERRSAKGRFA